MTASSPPANAPVAKLVVACFTPRDDGGVSVNLPRCYPTRTLETLVPKQALMQEADELEACAINELGKQAPQTPAEAHWYMTALPFRPCDYGMLWDKSNDLMYMLAKPNRLVDKHVGGPSAKDCPWFTDNPLLAYARQPWNQSQYELATGKRGPTARPHRW